jgi:hypothetical protein
MRRPSQGLQLPWSRSVLSNDRNKSLKNQQLCYQVMDYPHVARHAIIFAGTLFTIALCVPVYPNEDGTLRCAMFISGMIEVTNRDTPLVALLLHMLVRESQPAFVLASGFHTYNSIRTIAERVQDKPPGQPATHSEAQRERSTSVSSVSTVRNLRCLEFVSNLFPA